MPRLPPRLRRWADALLRQLTVVAFALRDPRTPWGPRLLAVAVLAYALSPLDLIPDAIPLLGLLDDLLLVPLGVALVLRLLPPEVLNDARAATGPSPLADLRRRLGRPAAVAVVATWLALALLLAWLLLRGRSPGPGA